LLPPPVLWIGSIVAYWVLWSAAFTHSDESRIVPTPIGGSLATSIIAGGAAFNALLVAATVIHIRSGNLPQVTRAV
jgi:hypothetical protein